MVTRFGTRHAPLANCLALGGVMREEVLMPGPESKKSPDRLTGAGLRNRRWRRTTESTTRQGELTAWRDAVRRHQPEGVEGHNFLFGL